MRNEAKMASGIFIGFTEQVEIYNHTHARRHAGMHAQVVVICKNCCNQYTYSPEYVY